MKNERRQFTRHRVVDNVYAALGRKYARVGPIFNISMGGLAFDHVSGDSSNHNDLIIDIFTEKAVFGLYNLPCSVVYDCVVKSPEVRNQYMELLSTHRCGVKFGRLGKEKLRQFEKFLSVHTATFAK
jgi:hypothetical protein